MSRGNGFKSSVSPDFTWIAGPKTKGPPDSLAPTSLLVSDDENGAPKGVC